MSSALPPFSLTTLAIAISLLVLWVLTRVIMRLSSQSAWKWLLTPVSFFFAWGFWWTALHSMNSLVETASTWPPSMLSLLSASTCEIALTLYVDHRLSRAGWLHWLPIGMRLSLILLLSFILMEPIVSHQDEHLDQRYVAVLVDESTSMKLSAASATSVGSERQASRQDLARKLMLEDRSGAPSILDQLDSDYGVNLYEFASSPRRIKVAGWRGEDTAHVRKTNPSSDSSIADWANSTDVAAAIRRVTDTLPFEKLSGLILLTDGCDHSRGDLQESVGALAQLKIPIHTVLLGDQLPIRDAEVSAVQAPQQVFVGDSVAIRAPIKVDRLAGKSVIVRLMKDSETIQEKTIEVRSARHRETVFFHDQANSMGIQEYSVHLDSLPGERTPKNNHASCRVSVAKDYIRMLIVESRPRWEFRYLKNLFAGRDRSVRLQYVLLHPDRLAGVPEPPSCPHL